MAASSFTIRPPAIPKVPGLLPKKKKKKKKLPPGAENRRVERITLKELNVEGAELLRSKMPQIKKLQDKRPGYMKVLDVLDLPRNLVANVIGSLAGVEKGKLTKATLGLPRVYMSDVLKKLGVKNKVVAGIAGFAADVAIDPLLYASLGATTGLRIAKGVPKILKPGTQALRQAAPKLARGQAVGKEVASAVLGRSAARAAATPKVGRLLTRRILAKQIQKQGQTASEAIKAAKAMLKTAPGHQLVAKAEKLAAKALMGKRGGVLGGMLAKGAFPRGAATTTRLQAARKFITKFGEKGRTIARAPFAASGITLPVGKKAALFRRFAETAAGKNLEYLIRTASAVESAGLLAVKNAIAIGQKGKATAELDKVIAAAKKTKTAVTAARKAKTIPARAKQVRFRTAEIRKADRRLDILTGIKDGLEAESIPTGKAVRGLQAKGIEVTPGAKALIKRLSDPAKRTQIGQLRRRIAEVKRVKKAAEKAAPKIREFTPAEVAVRTPAALAQMEKKARQPLLKARQPLLKARVGELGQIAEQAQAGEVAARAAATGLRTSPAAPLEMRQAATAALGNVGLAPDATRAQKAIHGLRGIKQKIFGPGPSALHQREVGIAQQAGMGAKVAGLRAHAKYGELIKPVVAEMADVLKVSGDDAMARLYNILETGGTKGLQQYHVADPLRQSVGRSLQELAALQPKLLGDIDRVAGEVRPFLDKLRKVQELARVAPGKVDDFLPRVASEEFRAVSPENIKRVLGGKGFTSPRVNLIEYRPKGGAIVQIISSDKPEIAKMKALLAAGEAEKVGTYKISAQWWNSPQSRTWGRKLAPKGFVGPQFSTDIGEAVGSAAQQSEVRLATGQLRDMAAETGTRLTAEQLHADPIFRHYAKETMNRNSPLYQTVLKDLDGMSFPQPVTDMLNRATYVSSSPAEVGKVLSWSDKYLNIWKSVTLMHPAYTTRNVVQNLLGGAMQGATPGRVVGNSRQVHKFVKAALDGKPITGTINIRGVPVPAAEFIKDARIWNQMSSGMMSQAMTADKFKRAKSMVGRLGRTWYRWNNEIESTMKVAVFKTFLDDGMTVRQAAMKTLLAMPDLTDLSRLEREFGRRVFPWISWMRRNTALQLFHYLPKKPIFAASSERFRHSLQQAFSGDDAVERELRPEWMEDVQAAQIAGDKEEGQLFMLANWLPFDEMIKIFTGPFDPQAAMRSALEQMRPEIKFGAELGVGVDIFRRQALPKFSLAEYAAGALPALAGRSRTPLDNVLAVRPVREAFRVAEMSGLAAGAQRVALGGAFQPVSRVRGLRAESIRLREELQKARSGINRARQVSDPQLAQTLTIKYFQILRRMQQLGIPGVPKASAALLEQSGIAAGSGLSGEQ